MLSEHVFWSYGGLVNVSESDVLFFATRSLPKAVSGSSPCDSSLQRCLGAGLHRGWMASGTRWGGGRTGQQLGWDGRMLRMEGRSYWQYQLRQYPFLLPNFDAQTLVHSELCQAISWHMSKKVYSTGNVSYLEEALGLCLPLSAGGLLSAEMPTSVEGGI